MLGVGSSEILAGRDRLKNESSASLDVSACRMSSPKLANGSSKEGTGEDCGEASVRSSPLCAAAGAAARSPLETIVTGTRYGGADDADGVASASTCVNGILSPRGASTPCHGDGQEERAGAPELGAIRDGVVGKGGPPLVHMEPGVRNGVADVDQSFRDIRPGRAPGAGLGSHPGTKAHDATPYKVCAADAIVRDDGDAPVPPDADEELDAAKAEGMTGDEPWKSPVGQPLIQNSSFKAARAVFSPPKPAFPPGKAGVLPRTIGRKGVWGGTAEAPRSDQKAASLSGADKNGGPLPVDTGVGAATTGDAAGGETEVAAEGGGVEKKSAASGRAGLPPSSAPSSRGSADPCTPNAAVGGVMAAGNGGSVEGGRASRTASGLRRISRSDLFFECTAEVDQMSATDDNSEPDGEGDWTRSEGGGDREDRSQRRRSPGGGIPDDPGSARANSPSSSPKTTAPTPSVSSSVADNNSSPGGSKRSSTLGMMAILGGPNLTLPTAVPAARSRGSPRASPAQVAELGAVGGKPRAEGEGIGPASGEREVSKADGGVDREAGGRVSLSPGDACAGDDKPAGTDAAGCARRSRNCEASGDDGKAGAQPEAGAEAGAGAKPEPEAEPEAEAEPGPEGGGDGVRGPGGRRRNRRRVPEWELQLGAEAYEDDSSLARFSQGEVDAIVRERLAEQNAAFEKTVAELKTAHEAELEAALSEERPDRKAGDQAMMLDREALEREIGMLSERFGEAASEASAKSKALVEKETLLDAVTAQLMGLKSDLAAERTAHATEIQSLMIELESEKKRLNIADNQIQVLQQRYNGLEDEERQKRSAGILKMKRDMQALAQAQFAEANKMHNVVKARLKAAEQEVAQLRQEKEKMKQQLEAASGETEDLREQVNALQGGHAESLAEAGRREKLLQEELVAFRAAAADRKDEAESLARELEASKENEELAQATMARMAMRNNELKAEVKDAEEKTKELEAYCTELLDRLEYETSVSNTLRAAADRASSTSASASSGS